MTRDELFDTVKRNILEVLPDLDACAVTGDKSMKDLGANSIDRADVIIQTMEQLGVTFKISELAEIRSIGGLVDFLALRSPRAR